MMYNYDEFPTEHMRGAAQRWIENALTPGGFLTAVLENDLKGAVARADHMNLAKLPEIVQWFTWNAPSSCWGSPEKVEAWTGTKE